MIDRANKNKARIRLIAGASVQDEESVALLIPPSMHGGQVFRVVGREGRAVPERWDVQARAWVPDRMTATAIAYMPVADPELLARLGILPE